ncbi:FAD:protein FMN transferase [Rhodobium gokarnense]|uniref:FAD:protein FMN transferase n=1 Tax=Rhodobium gokarnense TaxID=364296 RepID=A0ABT3H963_9HYPH|nr:FAD:protein FMN transferase [Rhodobium gokarnense]MCW2306921.1 thiamine biosynthesis lipoprotein [Rhodobium gokarnense]
MHSAARFFARAFLLILIVSGIAACDERHDDARYTLYVFGTLVEIAVPAAEKARADAAMPEITARFAEMHRDWHAWRPGETTRLDKAIAEGRSMTVSPLLKDALLRGRELEEKSGGLFNPAIGKLIGLWGFHQDDRPVGPPPDDEAIATLVARHPSMADLVIDGNEVSSTNPAVELDFGGFAKGLALDWAAERLKERGIPDAVLNAGGDVNVIGRHGKRRWHVAIRDPNGWGVLGAVKLEPDEVLYTSGNYYRYREHDGVRYSHIIDPRSGRPVDHIVSASVIADNGALADAAATALSIAGPDGWQETARRMGLTLVLLVDADGTILMTPQMKERVELEEEDVKMVIEDVQQAGAN